MPPRFVPLALVALVALVALAGCDGDSLLGEFVGTTEVEGAVRAVEGEAVYTVVGGAAGPEFVLGLFVGDRFESDFDAYDYVLFRRPGGRPGVGAYGIDGDPDRAFGATLAQADDADEPLETTGVALNGVSGTLAVTGVDGYGFVSGTYAFEAEGVRLGPPSAGRSASVGGRATGTFEARYEPPSTFRALGLDLGI